MIQIKAIVSVSDRLHSVQAEQPRHYTPAAENESTATGWGGAGWKSRTAALAVQRPWGPPPSKHDSLSYQLVNTQTNYSHLCKQIYGFPLNGSKHYKTPKQILKGPIGSCAFGDAGYEFLTNHSTVMHDSTFASIFLRRCERSLGLSYDQSRSLPHWNCSHLQKRILYRSIS